MNKYITLDWYYNLSLKWICKIDIENTCYMYHLTILLGKLVIYFTYYKKYYRDNILDED